MLTFNESFKTSIIMRFIKLLFSVLIVVFASSSTSFAQDDEESTGEYSSKRPYHITLKDGSSYTGFIVKDDARELLVKTTTIGDIYIRKSDIAKIVEVDDLKKMKQGKYFGDEIYFTRYFFTPTAYSLPKGEANAFMPYAFVGGHGQFGITDNFDLGVGTTWWGNPLVVTLKASFDIGKNLTGAIGAIGLTQTYRRFNANYFGGGGVFGVVTTGEPSQNASLGGGYAIFTNDGVTSNAYYATGGAYKRLRPQLAVAIEGFYFPQLEMYLALPGIRYFRKRREGEMIDIGFMLTGFNFRGSVNYGGGLPYFSYIITL
jgi:hypothetical protein